MTVVCQMLNELLPLQNGKMPEMMIVKETFDRG
jgi:hypothetical protein